MFANYLYIALRFLKKNKVFAIVNIISLSIALAVSFIIIIYVVNELSSNNVHKNKKLVYRIVNYYKEFNATIPSTPFVLAATLKEEFPQVKNATNIKALQKVRILHNDNEFNVLKALATDSEIFDIFTFNMVNGGNTNSLLDDKYSICLSRNLAEKLFSGTDVVGKEIVTFINNEKHILTIKAVFENVPKNSTLKAECLLNNSWTVDKINKSFLINDSDKSWTHDFWTTWVLLNKDSDLNFIEDQFRILEYNHISENPNRKYSLQNLSDVYLKSDNIKNSGVKGSMKNIKLFSMIAFLIVLIAAINYIILSNIVSSGRTKEIGIRKTNGAGKKQIRNQFLIESILLTMLVFPIAFFLMIVSLSYISELFQIELNIIKSNIIIYVVIYFVLTLLIGLASGLYTSIWLSRLHVMNILKATILVGNKKKFFRSILIIIQLIIFITFLSSTLIIHSQYKYNLSKNPGFHNQNILLIDVNNFNSYNSFLNEIKANPNVIMASGAMSGIPITYAMSAMYPHFINNKQKIKVEEFCVDYDFIKTMGISVKDGRDFSRSFGSDLENSCIINETAVKELGILNPINKQLGPYTIIGIVKDFNLHSFHTDISPLMITLTDEYIEQIAVHYINGSFNKLVSTLEKSWIKISQEQPFKYVTIEELIKGLYSDVKNTGSIISIVTLFTMLIASFGLFGLTLFIAKSRTKEIGIRKVFGCSDASVIYSFMKMNILYVFISSMISIPITIFVMSKWLSNYAFRIEIKWWFFVISFSIAVIIVMLTVFLHSYRASRINPVDTLRYE